MRVWTLASLPLWRKYIGPINIVMEFFRVASDSSGTVGLFLRAVYWRANLGAM